MEINKYKEIIAKTAIYPKEVSNFGIAYSWLGLIEEAIVVEEIAACGPGLATSLFGNTLGQEPLMLCNNEAAKEKYLPIFIKEPKVISFATSEPMMGSDVAGMRCLAKQDPETGDYILISSFCLLKK